VTAKPAWVYRQVEAKDESFNTLRFFIEKYITDDKAGCLGKTFTLAVVLTGDIHHYSRYVADSEKGPIQFITAGGGGAALHLTHDLPPQLTRVEEESLDEAKGAGKKRSDFALKNARLRAVYPSAAISKTLAAQNLLFFWKNKGISTMFGVFYLLLFWLVQSNTLAAGSYMAWVDGAGFGAWAQQTLRALAYTPVAIVLCLLMLFIFWSFGDNKKKSFTGSETHFSFCRSASLRRRLFGALGHCFTAPVQCRGGQLATPLAVCSRNLCGRFSHRWFRHGPLPLSFQPHFAKPHRRRLGLTNDTGLQKLSAPAPDG
jgi:hypothetical protein